MKTRMPWTKDLPTEPGYYWCRWIGAAEDRAPFVVEIEDVAGRLEVSYCGNDDSVPLADWAVDHTVGGRGGGILEWSAPIEPPA